MRVVALQASPGAPSLDKIRTWLRGKYGVSAFGRLPDEHQDAAIDAFEHHFFPATASSGA